MPTTRKWWLVATLAVVVSHASAVVLGGFVGLALLLLLGGASDAIGLDLGHAGGFLLFAVSIPVLVVLMAVPAMLVVRLFRGAHPVLGPFAAACAGLPVAAFVGAPADSFLVGVLVGAVVEVPVLALLVRPDRSAGTVPVVEPVT
jgi:hypothetical protein